jgi:hypothetical protein
MTVMVEGYVNIVGGFARMEEKSQEWQREAWENDSKADESIRGFFFAQRNPGDLPARRSPLEARKRDKKTGCDAVCGLHFGGIGVNQSC